VNTTGSVTATTILEVRDLGVRLPTGEGPRQIIDGVDISLAQGEALGLVGESGSGKSTTLRSIVRLLPKGAEIDGRVTLAGADVLTLPDPALRRLRGTEVAVVFQDPRVHINPLRSVGDFLIENLVDVQQRPRREAESTVRDILRSVGISDADRRMRQRPYELSGGLLQRVMIAAALATGPKLILADEPTTALDVTTQEEVMAILDEERRARGLAMLFISHDLDLADAVCDRIAVMKDGTIVEELGAEGLRQHATHDYTRALIAARPTLDPAHTVPAGQPDSSTDEPVLSVRDLRKVYRVRPTTGRAREDFVAVEGISFDLRPGGSLAVVGESGSGKSTTAGMIVGLTRPTGGQVVIGGESYANTRLGAKQRRARGRKVQMVFQDPYSSLDRRQTVRDCLREVLDVHGHVPVAQRDDRVDELIAQVGLTSTHARSLPRHLSGGQRQRVAIARALAADPSVLILDEALSALDVSVQAQVIDLLVRIREETGVALLFISHDLPVVAHISDEVLVMHRGLVVESGPVHEVLREPREDYTRELIDSVPREGWTPRRRSSRLATNQGVS